MVPRAEKLAFPWDQTPNWLSNTKWSALEIYKYTNAKCTQWVRFVLCLFLLFIYFCCFGGLLCMVTTTFKEQKAIHLEGMEVDMVGQGDKRWKERKYVIIS